MYRSLLGAQLLTFGVFMFSIFYNFLNSENSKKICIHFFWGFLISKIQTKYSKKIAKNENILNIVFFFEYQKNQNIQNIMNFSQKSLWTSFFGDFIIFWIFEFFEFQKFQNIQKI